MSAVIKVLNTGSSHVPILLRVGLGLVILPHGLQKVFGWFGGFGFAGTMDFFTQTMGFPYLLGLAAIVAESVGAVLLILGLATRVSALVIGVTMFVAMVTVHLPYGFFMNWSGSQAGEGVEFFVLTLALAAALVLSGGGALSVDRVIVEKVTGGSYRDAHAQ